MRYFLLVPIALFINAWNCFPQAPAESVYTGLTEKNCREIKAEAENGILYRGRCAGVGGYDLALLASEHHQSLNLVAPGGREFELDMALSAAPSALGKKAEWRVRRKGGGIIPHALIVRVNVFDDIDDRDRARSYLVVARIAGSGVCVTDVIEPSVKDQNRRARELADAAAEKPCANTKRRPE